MENLLRLCSYLLLLVALPLASALKMDVLAHPGHEAASKERCIRNFVAKDQLVVVTVIIDGVRGDGQQLNMHVCLLTKINSLLVGEYRVLMSRRADS
jgi:p24 family protein delta-1